jgi:hypothetical protein
MADEQQAAEEVPNAPIGLLQAPKKPRTEKQLQHLAKLTAARREKADAQNKVKEEASRLEQAEEKRQMAILEAMVVKKSVRLTKQNKTANAKAVAALAARLDEQDDEADDEPPRPLQRAKKAAQPPVPIPASIPAPAPVPKGPQVRIIGSTKPQLITVGNVRFL